MDALALEGARFPGAVAPVPLTLPSHASILTGLDPARHGVRDNGAVFPEGVATLPELLGREGWATGAVVSGFPLRAEFGLDRGFGSYDDRLPQGPGGAWAKRPAPDSATAGLAFVSRQEAAEPGRPWFLWIHFYDPHDPYAPPARLRHEGDRGGYDGEVAFVDEAIGALERALANRGRRRELLTVFAADHGESLGEHGEATHGFFVYDATVLVPLAFRWPGRIAPREIRAPARLVDVSPTVLDLLGLAVPRGLDGRPLAPLLDGSASAWDGALVESFQPWLGYGWAPLRAFRKDGWKLIDAPRPELYDLAADAAEERDRHAAEPRRAAVLRRALEDAVARPPVSSVAQGAAPDDAERQRQLRSLGYLGGSVSASAPFPADAADPKDRLATRAALLDAEAARDRGEIGPALAAFRRVLAEEPSNRLALLRAGQLLVSLGRPADAVAPLEALLSLDPGQGEARWALADALTRAGRAEDAEAAWGEVVRIQPLRAAAWSNLGSMRCSRGDLDGALAAVRHAARLAPSDGDLASNLGELLLEAARRASARGDRGSASALAAEAVALDPSARRRVAPNLAR